MFKLFFSCSGVLLFCCCNALHCFAAEFNKIVVPESSHPALRSAARIVARELALPESSIQITSNPAQPAAREIILITAPASEAQAKLFGKSIPELKHDGYVIAFQNGGALIYG